MNRAEQMDQYDNDRIDLREFDVSMDTQTETDPVMRGFRGQDAIA